MSELITGELKTYLFNDIRPAAIMIGIQRDLWEQYPNKPDVVEGRLWSRSAIVIAECLGFSPRELGLDGYVRSVVEVGKFLLQTYPTFFPSLIDYKKISKQKKKKNIEKEKNLKKNGVFFFLKYLNR